jgi:predicted dehydrogenase
MNTKTLGLGIIGCGDFLRLQAPGILRSKGLKVSAVFDPDAARAQRYADELKGRFLSSAEALIDDKEVDVVGIFVPPWARKPLVLRAAAAGKHIITTKPLAPQISDCEEMVRAVEKAGIVCGVIYNRTEDAKVETLKRLFESGRYGTCALFKQDWLHHYPSWNTWALDPQRNGGPFMDAMIHNLNIARYLMGRPAQRGTFFSDKHAHPDLACADTEFLKLDFEGNGSAHLFITWAADLAVYDTSGNHREHIDIWYAVTDQGYKITGEQRGNESLLNITRHGEKIEIPLLPISETPYENLARAIREKSPLTGILPSITEAAEDIRIIRQTSAKAGSLVVLKK